MSRAWKVWGRKHKKIFKAHFSIKYSYEIILPIMAPHNPSLWPPHPSLIDMLIKEPKKKIKFSEHVKSRTPPNRHPKDNTKQSHWRRKWENNKNKIEWKVILLRENFPFLFFCNAFFIKHTQIWWCRRKKKQ